MAAETSCRRLIQSRMEASLAARTADLIATGQMLGMSPTIGNYAKSATPCEGLEAVPP